MKTSDRLRQLIEEALPGRTVNVGPGRIRSGHIQRSQGCGVWFADLDRATTLVGWDTMTVCAQRGIQCYVNEVIWGQIDVYPVGHDDPATRENLKPAPMRKRRRPAPQPGPLAEHVRKAFLGGLNDPAVRDEIRARWYGKPQS